jgi:hypothetical protein
MKYGKYWFHLQFFNKLVKSEKKIRLSRGVAGVAGVAVWS